MFGIRRITPAKRRRLIHPTLAITQVVRKTWSFVHSRGKRVIQQIIEAPDRCPVLEEDIRRCLVRVFPYAVLYSIETDYV
jgi:hypothetical protein